MFKLRDILVIALTLAIINSSSYLPIFSKPKSTDKPYKISSKGLEFIKQQEGFRSKPYSCAAGVLTVGYGSTYIGDRRVKYSDRVTEAEAEAIMLNHIANNCPIIDKTIKVKLSQDQYDSLCSIVYRLGSTRFVHSKIPQFINNGDFQQIGNVLHKYSHVKSKSGYVLSNGLVKRADLEKQLLASK